MRIEKPNGCNCCFFFLNGELQHQEGCKSQKGKAQDSKHVEKAEESAPIEEKEDS